MPRIPYKSSAEVLRYLNGGTPKLPRADAPYLFFATSASGLIENVKLSLSSGL